jgi:hypothetical protein
MLAMKSYAPYHLLYAISQCFAIASNQQQVMPNPSISYASARKFFKDLGMEVNNNSNSLIRQSLNVRNTEINVYEILRNIRQFCFRKKKNKESWK